MGQDMVVLFARLNGRECGKALKVGLDDSISSLSNFCDFQTGTPIACKTARGTEFHSGWGECSGEAKSPD